MLRQPSYLYNDAIVRSRYELFFKLLKRDEMASQEQLTYAKPPVANILKEYGAEANWCFS